MNIEQLQQLIDFDTILYSSAGAAILLAAGLLIKAIVKNLEKSKDKRRLLSIVKSISPYYLRDFTCADGVNGFIHIDYMLLTPSGLWVLTEQDFPGNIFGGANIEQWTQVVQNKSYKFQNPLPYNRECAQAIRNFDPEMHVHHLTVFTSAGTFPKGIPEKVSLTNKLRQDIAPHATKENPPTKDQISRWHTLKQQIIGSQVAAPISAHR